MVDQHLRDVGPRAPLDCMLISGATAHRTASGARRIEGGHEVARLGGAFPPLGRKNAADLRRMCVEAHRQVDVQLERQARDVGAESGGHRYRLFDTVPRSGNGIAEHR